MVEVPNTIIRLKIIARR